MDDQAQGIVDQPVTAAEMAAIDQAASQFGAVVQPMSAAPVAAPVNPTSMVTTPGIVEPSNDVTPQPITDEASAPGQEGKTFLDPNQPVSTEENTTLDGVEDEAKLNTPSRVNLAPITPETPPVDLQALLAAEETPVPLTEDPLATPPTPAPETVLPAAMPVPVPVPEPSAVQTLSVPPMTQTGVGDDEELLSIKQQALEQLTPIVDTIELPAEERFDTLMMIIRASDDKKLIKPAYEAANEITDADKKARALLDVVNEVNYLTQLQAHQE